MKPFSSLFAKIILCLLLNLVLVVGLLVAFIDFQARVDLPAIFGHWVTDRLNIAATIIAHDLGRENSSEWPEILTRHKEIYQIDFALVTAEGTVYTSDGLAVPEEVVDRITSDSIPPLDDVQQDIPQAELRGKRINHNRGGKEVSVHRLVMHTGAPDMHWVGIRVSVAGSEKPHEVSAMLLACSESITGNGFFFEPMPWIIAAAAVILISVLLWIPMVRHITKPLGRMTRAAEEIANGKFDVTIREQRRDEIGRLSSSINHMTSRLRGFVGGQKRFLRDVAHELGSPIARMQFGIGILEQHVDKENTGRLADVAEDVTHMSNLVNELLSFSRAELNPEKVKVEKIFLSPIAEHVARREGIAAEGIEIDIDPGLEVVANRSLLSRAAANLVRNAVAYAGQAGAIRIAAKKEKNRVLVEVQDAGPGVPESLIEKIFEPFFRPESARDRESGGVGLGLSIVKTCMDACGGNVTARNLQPKGFSVILNLPAPE
jgi:two-component system sensor histidine kinase CpxA